MDAVLVAYRGAAPLISDVLGGQIDAGFPSYVPQVEAVTALGVTTDARLDFLPQVPTIGESGIADVVAATWNALLAPAGTPPKVVIKLNSIVNVFLTTERARQELAKLGARPIGGTPEQVTKLITGDRARWAPVIEAANIASSNNWHLVMPLPLFSTFTAIVCRRPIEMQFWLLLLARPRAFRLGTSTTTLS